MERCDADFRHTIPAKLPNEDRQIRQKYISLSGMMAERESDAADSECLRGEATMGDGVAIVRTCV